MSVEYYKLHGTDDNEPSGLFRIRRTDDGVYYEYIDDSDNWVLDFELFRYINGDSDLATEITEAEANKVRQFIKDRIKEDLAEAERY